MELNKNSEKALYLQLADMLAADIKAKRLLPLERLPSEYELTRTFKVSRVTVRQAIKVLSDWGLVVPRQGKGVFVMGPKLNQGLNDLRGFYDSLLLQGLEPETEVVAFTPPGLAAIEPAVHVLSNVCRFTRVYRVEGAVMTVAEAALSCFDAKVTIEDVRAMPVYSLISEVVKKRVVRAATEIRTVRPSAEIAQYLELDDDAWVLQMDRTSFDESGLILEHSRFHIQPEGFAFHLEIAGPMQIVKSVRPAQPPTPSSDEY